MAQAAAWMAHKLRGLMTTANGIGYHVIHIITFVVGKAGVKDYAMKPTTKTDSEIRKVSAAAQASSGPHPTVAGKIKVKIKTGMSEWTMHRAAVEARTTDTKDTKKAIALSVKGTYCKLPEVAAITGKVNWSMAEHAAAKGIIESFTPLHIALPGIKLTSDKLDV